MKKAGPSANCAPDCFPHRPVFQKFPVPFLVKTVVLRTVFSKWPWISELYLFSYIAERGEPAYWTNLQLWRAKFDMKLTEKTGLSLAYNYLLANENPDESYIMDIFGSGKEREHLYFEYFRPGDFYASDYRDDAMFLRWQLQIKF